MTAAGVEKLVWILIYGGLLLLGLGLFVQREHDPIGWTMVVVGVSAAVAGVVLIWIRARMKD